MHRIILGLADYTNKTRTLAHICSFSCRPDMADCEWVLADDLAVGLWENYHAHKPLWGSQGNVQKPLVKKIPTLKTEVSL